MQPRALSAARTRELDRRAIEEYGIPSIVLMENAGRACADEVARLLDHTGDRGRRTGAAIVLCGPGNNGGDGLVIARTLRNRGYAIAARFVGDREKLASLSPDFRLNERLWRGLGEELPCLSNGEDLQRLRTELAAAPVVVDALFGTGLTRPPARPWTEAIEAINSCEAPVLAVDVPSGLDADTGEIRGACVRASVTVTFVASKLGFTRAAGPSHVGRVHVAEIGIPHQWIAEAGLAEP